jgi:hypothetical protein
VVLPADDDADYWNELNNSLTRYLEELELTRERVGLAAGGRSTGGSP